MLYLNAYRVGRAYGGPEEGGWWYDVGEPLAAIPIPSTFERGKTYYMNGGMAVIEKCRDCDGTGMVPCGDDDCDCTREGHSYQHSVACGCGEFPADPEALAKLNEHYRELLKDEVAPRRHEELRLSVESQMAHHWPEGRPHYE